jgi:hypothetical protein
MIKIGRLNGKLAVYNAMPLVPPIENEHDLNVRKAIR